MEVRHDQCTWDCSGVRTGDHVVAGLGIGNGATLPRRSDRNRQPRSALHSARRRRIVQGLPRLPRVGGGSGGDFMMGAAAGEVVATKPEDQVRVSIAKPFAVGRFAVTRSEFAAFGAATNRGIERPCHRLGEHGKIPQHDWRSPGFAQDDRHPVVCVSWHDAKAYVAWLSSTTGRRYRLPSETEREFVTRGAQPPRSGGATPFRPIKPTTTDALPMPAVPSASGAMQPSRWQQLSGQSLGLYNVHGNVWDWTEDAGTRRTAVIEPMGTAGRGATAILRVVRGGSFNNVPHMVRAARRDREPVGTAWSLMDSCREGFLIGAFISVMQRAA